MSLKNLNHYAGTMLLIVSVALNVVLSKRLMALQAVGASLQAGERVPALEVKALDGRPAQISYDGALPTLIYYFSPTCGWCERNWDNVRTLTAVAPHHFRVVGLSPTSKDVEKVMRQHDVNFEVFTTVSSEALRAYRLHGTPDTVLVSP